MAMNAEQTAALAQLRQSVVAILPDLSFGPGSRGDDMRMWLAELDREHTPFARIRTIAASLRSVGTELARQPDPPDLAAAATSLVEAATGVLVAF